MISAFQSGAFQQNAFQIAAAASGSVPFGGSRYQSARRLYKVNGQSLYLTDRELRTLLEQLAKPKPVAKQPRRVREVIEAVEDQAPGLLDNSDPLLRLEAIQSLQMSFDDSGMQLAFANRLIEQIKRQIELEIDDEDVILLLMH